MEDRPYQIVSPIILDFDPMDSESDFLRWTFMDDVARTLYLTWRQGHIVDDQFPGQMRAIVGAIKGQPPRTLEEFIECFQASGQLCENGMPRLTNFPTGDVRRYCIAALPYFTGKAKIEFIIKLPGKES